MSGIPRRKVKPPTASLIKPEDVAIKPKPPMHAAKRPQMSVGQGQSTVTMPSKKARMDMSTSAGPQIPLQKNMMSSLGPNSLVKPPLDTNWLEFCRSTPITFSSFAETLNSAFTEQKVNKAAKLITSAFRCFMEKKIDAHKFFIEYHLLTTCAVAIKEHGDKLQNLYLHKCLLSMLSWMKPLAADRQELIVALATSLAEKQQQLDPYYYTAFLHDTLGDRHWIDKPICMRLLSLLLRPFGTRFPSRENYVASQAELMIPEIAPDLEAPNKFVQTSEELAEPLLEVLRKWWAAEPPHRNVLKAMSLLSGISEVRSMAAKRMDSWSQNGKLQRHALELLLFIGCNFGPASDSENDMEALAHLLKMRCLKSKQVISVFNVALKEIIARDPNNLKTAVYLIITNEFGPSPQRFPMNTTILQMLFSFDNLRMTKTFAQELSRAVINREELAKPARLFTREIFRSLLRTDFNYPVFAESYLNFILEEAFRSEHGIEDHVYRSATEVVTMLPLVAVSQPVREAFALRRSGTALSTEVQNTLTRAERDFSTYFDVVLKWLQNAKQLFMEYKDYFTAYYRYLFLEKAEYYTMMDQGPTESEFMHACKVFSDFRFSDNHIWLIVGEKFNTLNQEDTIDLLYDITKRSVSQRNHHDERGILLFTSSRPASSLVSRVLEVCLYKPSFMYNDQLLPMFVKNLYWKSWIMIILWACIGKPAIGLPSVYGAFPLFRLFVHMILTKQFAFPIAFDGKSEQEMLATEMQFCEKEAEDLVKQENLFEKHINSGTEVTELTSQLLQTCILAINDSVRRPPDAFLNDLKISATECQLVASLCENREPDLLKDLVDKYGAAKAMPAIQDLLTANAGAIETLPVLVLMEFLLFYFASDGRTRNSIGDDKVHLIKTRLRSAVDNDSECLLFVLRRFSSPSVVDRTAAHKTLSYILEDASLYDVSVLNYSRLLSVGCFVVAKRQLAIEVANSVSFEQEAARVADGVSFILKTMFLENMHQVSLAMSRLSHRSGSSLISSLMTFFEKYHTLCASKDTWSEEMGQDQHYIVKLPSGEISFTKDAISATLQLLCKSGKERSPARENLMKVWFPSSENSPTILCGGKEIDVFTDSLRSEMLCADDERITKVALENVHGPAAVQLLSSFGLTNFSATQLLSAVDKLSISDIGRERAMMVRPFIVAYQTRGAQGGDKFLKALKAGETADDSSVKCEKMDDDSVMYIQPPTHDQLILQEDVVIGKQEAIQILKDVTIPESPLLFLCPTKLVRSALENKEVALACVSHFEDHLKFFLANAEAFREIMTLLSNSADRFEEVRSKVTTLATKILKSAAVRPALDGYLRKFSPTAARKGERKSFGSIKNMSADEVLETLNKTAVVSSAERARLLNAYLEKRPEVVDRTTDCTILDKQLVAIFAGRNGVDGLVAQIHLRAPAETVSTILKRLLTNFDAKFIPMLVCEFVGYCCRPEYAFLQNKDQLAVLGHYLAEMVIRDSSHNIKAVALVEKLVNVSGFEVLPPICNFLISLERSDQEKVIRTRSSGLLQDLALKFPCVNISPLTNSITLRGPRWRLNQGDRFCSVQVSHLFESEDSDEIARALDSLHQLLETHPALVAREFGVMANQLSVILAKDSRDVKSQNRRHTIGLVRQTAIALMPKLQKEDMPHMDTAISLLIAIFERHVKSSASEMTLSEAIISLCYNYLEHHLESGREMLAEQGKSLEEICALHPDMPLSKAVREQIRVVSEAV